MLQDLKDLSKPGIFALLSSGKSIKIYASSNMLYTLTRIINDVSSNSIFKVLEIGPIDDVERSIRAGYWNTIYTSRKWCVESYYKPWKLLTQVLPFEYGSHLLYSEYRAFVIAKRKRNSITLGVFNTKEEANDFIQQYYKNGIETVIIANNEDTKRYYKEENT